MAQHKQKGLFCAVLHFLIVMLSVVMLSVVMLSVVMLNATMLDVVTPNLTLLGKAFTI
jgi:hypothetical protein